MSENQASGFIENLFNTAVDGVPIVGDAKEIYGTVQGIREKGIINSSIRGALSFVPNGPWTSVLEGSARFSGGKGWEQTIADWITGADKPQNPADDLQETLTSKDRKKINEMSKDTIDQLKKGKDIGAIVAEQLETIGKIKDPQKQAAMLMEYSLLTEADVMVTINKDGIIKKEEYAAMQNFGKIREEFDKGLANGTIENVAAAVAKNLNKGRT